MEGSIQIEGEQDSKLTGDPSRGDRDEEVDILEKNNSEKEREEIEVESEVESALEAHFDTKDKDADDGKKGTSEELKSSLVEKNAFEHVEYPGAAEEEIGELNDSTERASEEKIVKEKETEETQTQATPMEEFNQQLLENNTDPETSELNDSTRNDAEDSTIEESVTDAMNTRENATDECNQQLLDNDVDPETGKLNDSTRNDAEDSTAEENEKDATNTWENATDEGNQQLSDNDVDPETGELNDSTRNDAEDSTIGESVTDAMNNRENATDECNQQLLDNDVDPETSDMNDSTGNEAEDSAIEESVTDAMNTQDDAMDECNQQLLDNDVDPETGKLNDSIRIDAEDSTIEESVTDAMNTRENATDECNQQLLDNDVDPETGKLTDSIRNHADDSTIEESVTDAMNTQENATDECNQQLLDNDVDPETSDMNDSTRNEAEDSTNEESVTDAMNTRENATDKCNQQLLDNDVDPETGKLNDSTRNDAEDSTIEESVTDAMNNRENATDECNQQLLDNDVDPETGKLNDSTRNDAEDSTAEENEKDATNTWENATDEGNQQLSDNDVDPETGELNDSTRNDAEDSTIGESVTDAMNNRENATDECNQQLLDNDVDPETSDMNDSTGNEAEDSAIEESVTDAMNTQDDAMDECNQQLLDNDVDPETGKLNDSIRIDAEDSTIEESVTDAMNTRENATDECNQQLLDNDVDPETGKLTDSIRNHADDSTIEESVTDAMNTQENATDECNQQLLDNDVDPETSDMNDSTRNEAEDSTNEESVTDAMNTRENATDKCNQQLLDNDVDPETGKLNDSTRKDAEVSTIEASATDAMNNRENATDECNQQLSDSDVNPETGTLNDSTRNDAEDSTIEESVTDAMNTRENATDECNQQLLDNDVDPETGKLNDSTRNDAEDSTIEESVTDAMNNRENATDECNQQLSDNDVDPETGELNDSIRNDAEDSTAEENEKDATNTWENATDECNQQLSDNDVDPETGELNDSRRNDAEDSTAEESEKDATNTQESAMGEFNHQLLDNDVSPETSELNDSTRNETEDSTAKESETTAKDTRETAAEEFNQQHVDNDADYETSDTNDFTGNEAENSTAKESETGALNTRESLTEEINQQLVDNNADPETSELNDSTRNEAEDSAAKESETAGKNRVESATDEFNQQLVNNDVDYETSGTNDFTGNEAENSTAKESETDALNTRESLTEEINQQLVDNNADPETSELNDSKRNEAEDSTAKEFETDAKDTRESATEEFNQRLVDNDVDSETSELNDSKGNEAENSTAQECETDAIITRESATEKFNQQLLDNDIELEDAGLMDYKQIAAEDITSEECKTDELMTQENPIDECNKQFLDSTFDPEHSELTGTAEKVTEDATIEENASDDMMSHASPTEEFKKQLLANDVETKPSENIDSIESATDQPIVEETVTEEMKTQESSMKEFKQQLSDNDFEPETTSELNEPIQKESEDLTAEERELGETKTEENQMEEFKQQLLENDIEQKPIDLTGSTENEAEEADRMKIPETPLEELSHHLLDSDIESNVTHQIDSTETTTEDPTVDETKTQECQLDNFNNLLSNNDVNPDLTQVVIGDPAAEEIKTEETQTPENSLEMQESPTEKFNQHLEEKDMEQETTEPIYATENEENEKDETETQGSQAAEFSNQLLDSNVEPEPIDLAGEIAGPDPAAEEIEKGEIETQDSSMEKLNDQLIDNDDESAPIILTDFTEKVIEDHTLDETETCESSMEQIEQQFSGNNVERENNELHFSSENEIETLTSQEDEETKTQDSPLEVFDTQLQDSDVKPGHIERTVSVDISTDQLAEDSEAAETKTQESHLEEFNEQLLGNEPETNELVNSTQNAGVSSAVERTGTDETKAQMSPIDNDAERETIGMTDTAVNETEEPIVAEILADELKSQESPTEAVSQQLFDKHVELEPIVLVGSSENVEEETAAEQLARQTLETKPASSNVEELPVGSKVSIFEAAIDQQSVKLHQQGQSKLTTENDDSKSGTEKHKKLISFWEQVSQTSEGETSQSKSTTSVTSSISNKRSVFDAQFQTVLSSSSSKTTNKTTEQSFLRQTSRTDQRLIDDSETEQEVAERRPIDESEVAESSEAVETSQMISIEDIVLEAFEFSIEANKEPAGVSERHVHFDLQPEDFETMNYSNERTSESDIGTPFEKEPELEHIISSEAGEDDDDEEARRKQEEKEQAIHEDEENQTVEASDNGTENQDQIDTALKTDKTIESVQKEDIESVLSEYPEDGTSSLETSVARQSDIEKPNESDRQEPSQLESESEEIPDLHDKQNEETPEIEETLESVLIDNIEPQSSKLPESVLKNLDSLVSPFVAEETNVTVNQENTELEPQSEDEPELDLQEIEETIEPIVQECNKSAPSENQEDVPKVNNDSDVPTATTEQLNEDTQRDATETVHEIHETQDVSELEDTEVTLKTDLGDINEHAIKEDIIENIEKEVPELECQQEVKSEDESKQAKDFEKTIDIVETGDTESLASEDHKGEEDHKTEETDALATFTEKLTKKIENGITELESEQEVELEFKEDETEQAIISEEITENAETPDIEPSNIVEDVFRTETPNEKDTEKQLTETAAKSVNEQQLESDREEKPEVTDIGAEQTIEFEEIKENFKKENIESTHFEVPGDDHAVQDPDGLTTSAENQLENIVQVADLESDPENKLKAQKDEIEPAIYTEESIEKFQTADVESEASKNLKETIENKNLDASEAPADQIGKNTENKLSALEFEPVYKQQLECEPEEKPKITEDKTEQAMEVEELTAKVVKEDLPSLPTEVTESDLIVHNSEASNAPSEQPNECIEEDVTVKDQSEVKTDETEQAIELNKTIQIVEKSDLQSPPSETREDILKAEDSDSSSAVDKQPQEDIEKDRTHLESEQGDEQKESEADSKPEATDGKAEQVMELEERAETLIKDDLDSLPAELPGGNFINHNAEASKARTVEPNQDIKENVTVESKQQAEIEETEQAFEMNETNENVKKTDSELMRAKITEDFLDTEDSNASNVIQEQSEEDIEKYRTKLESETEIEPQEVKLEEKPEATDDKNERALGFEKTIESVEQQDSESAPSKFSEDGLIVHESESSKISAPNEDTKETTAKDEPEAENDETKQAFEQNETVKTVEKADIESTPAEATEDVVKIRESDASSILIEQPEEDLEKEYNEVESDLEDKPEKTEQEDKPKSTDERIEQALDFEETTGSIKKEDLESALSKIPENILNADEADASNILQEMPDEGIEKERTELDPIMGDPQVDSILEDEPDATDDKTGQAMVIEELNETIEKEGFKSEPSNTLEDGLVVHNTEASIIPTEQTNEDIKEKVTVENKTEAEIDESGQVVDLNQNIETVENAEIQSSTAKTSEEFLEGKEETTESIQQQDLDSSHSEILEDDLLVQDTGASKSPAKQSTEDNKEVTELKDVLEDEIAETEQTVKLNESIETVENAGIESALARVSDHSNVHKKQPEEYTEKEHTELVSKVVDGPFDYDLADELEATDDKTGQAMEIEELTESIEKKELQSDSPKTLEDDLVVQDTEASITQQSSENYKEEVSVEIKPEAELEVTEDKTEQVMEFEETTEKIVKEELESAPFGIPEDDFVVHDTEASNAATDQSNEEIKEEVTVEDKPQAEIGEVEEAIELNETAKNLEKILKTEDSDVSSVAKEQPEKIIEKENTKLDSEPADDPQESKPDGKLEVTEGKTEQAMEFEETTEKIVKEELESAPFQIPEDDFVVHDTEASNAATDQPNEEIKEEVTVEDKPQAEIGEVEEAIELNETAENVEKADIKTTPAENLEKILKTEDSNVSSVPKEQSEKVIEKENTKLDSEPADDPQESKPDGKLEVTEGKTEQAMEFEETTEKIVKEELESAPFQIPEDDFVVHDTEASNAATDQPNEEIKEEVTVEDKPQAEIGEVEEAIELNETAKNLEKILKTEDSDVSSVAKEQPEKIIEKENTKLDSEPADDPQESKPDGKLEVTEGKTEQAMEFEETTEKIVKEELESAPFQIPEDDFVVHDTEASNAATDQPNEEIKEEVTVEDKPQAEIGEVEEAIELNETAENVEKADIKTTPAENLEKILKNEDSNVSSVPKEQSEKVIEKENTKLDSEPADDPQESKPDGKLEVTEGKTEQAMEFEETTEKIVKEELESAPFQIPEDDFVVHDTEASNAATDQPNEEIKEEVTVEDKPQAEIGEVEEAIELNETAENVEKADIKTTPAENLEKILKTEDSNVSSVPKEQSEKVIEKENTKLDSEPADDPQESKPDGKLEVTEGKTEQAMEFEETTEKIVKEELESAPFQIPEDDFVVHDTEASNAATDQPNEEIKEEVTVEDKPQAEIGEVEEAIELNETAENVEKADIKTTPAENLEKILKTEDSNVSSVPKEQSEKVIEKENTKLDSEPADDPQESKPDGKLEVTEGKTEQAMEFEETTEKIVKEELESAPFQIPEDDFVVHDTEASNAATDQPNEEIKEEVTVEDKPQAEIGEVEEAIELNETAENVEKADIKTTPAENLEKILKTEDSNVSSVPKEQSEKVIEKENTKLDSEPADDPQESKPDGKLEVTEGKTEQAMEFEETTEKIVKEELESAPFQIPEDDFVVHDTEASNAATDQPNEEIKEEVTVEDKPQAEIGEVEEAIELNETAENVEKADIKTTPAENLEKILKTEDPNVSSVPKEQSEKDIEKENTELGSETVDVAQESKPDGKLEVTEDKTEQAMEFEETTEKIEEVELEPAPFGIPEDDLIVHYAEASSALTEQSNADMEKEATGLDFELEDKPHVQSELEDKLEDMDDKDPQGSKLAETDENIQKEDIELAPSEILEDNHKVEDIIDFPALTEQPIKNTEIEVTELESKAEVKPDVQNNENEQLLISEETFKNVEITEMESTPSKTLETEDSDASKAFKDQPNEVIENGVTELDSVLGDKPLLESEGQDKPDEEIEDADALTSLTKQPNKDIDNEDLVSEPKDKTEVKNDENEQAIDLNETIENFEKTDTESTPSEVPEDDIKTEDLDDSMAPTKQPNKDNENKVTELENESFEDIENQIGKQFETEKQIELEESMELAQGEELKSEQSKIAAEVPDQKETLISSFVADKPEQEEKQEVTELEAEKIQTPATDDLKNQKVKESEETSESVEESADKMGNTLEIEGREVNETVESLQISDLDPIPTDLSENIRQSMEALVSPPVTEEPTEMNDQKSTELIPEVKDEMALENKEDDDKANQIEIDTQIENQNQFENEKVAEINESNQSVECDDIESEIPEIKSDFSEKFEATLYQSPAIDESDLSYGHLETTHETVVEEKLADAEEKEKTTDDSAELSEDPGVQCAHEMLSKKMTDGEPDEESLSVLIDKELLEQSQRSSFSEDQLVSHSKVSDQILDQVSAENAGTSNFDELKQISDIDSDDSTVVDEDAGIAVDASPVRDTPEERKTPVQDVEEMLVVTNGFGSPSKRRGDFSSDEGECMIQLKGSLRFSNSIRGIPESNGFFSDNEHYFSDAPTLNRSAKYSNDASYYVQSDTEGFTQRGRTSSKQSQRPNVRSASSYGILDTYARGISPRPYCRDLQIFPPQQRNGHETDPGSISTLRRRQTSPETRSGRSSSIRDEIERNRAEFYASTFFRPPKYSWSQSQANDYDEKTKSSPKLNRFNISDSPNKTLPKNAKLSIMKIEHQPEQSLNGSKENEHDDEQAVVETNSAKSQSLQKTESFSRSSLKSRGSVSKQTKSLVLSKVATDISSPVTPEITKSDLKPARTGEIAVAPLEPMDATLPRRGRKTKKSSETKKKGSKDPSGNNDQSRSRSRSIVNAMRNLISCSMRPSD